jgi:hypothetical protein
VRCIETSTNDNKINFLGYLRAVIVTSASEEIELRHCGGLLAGWGPASVYIFWCRDRSQALWSEQFNRIQSP